MRGTVAKRLRKQAALTTAKTRQYSILHKVYEGTKRIIFEDKTSETINVETVKYSGYRRIYQDLKRQYVRG